MATIKQSDNNKYYQWYGETGISHIAVGNAKWCMHFGNSSDIPQNVKKKKKWPRDPAIPH